MALIRIDRGGDEKIDAPELRQKLREASEGMASKLKPLEKRKQKVDANLRKSRLSGDASPVKLWR